MSFLSLRNICKIKDKLTLLNDVSLEIEKSDLLAILGPSGSGKSTLLNVLTGLEDFNYGEIWFRDKLISNLDYYLHPELLLKSNAYKAYSHLNNNEEIFLKIKENREIKYINENPIFKDACKNFLLQHQSDCSFKSLRFGIVEQTFDLFPNLTIWENVLLGAYGNSLNAQKKEDLACYYLNFFDIPKEKYEFYPCQLSGGQKQRIAIIRELMFNPDILCFDEPTSALDQVMIKKITILINDLVKKGITVIFITHDLKFAKATAKKIIYLDKGSLVDEGGAKILRKC